MIVGRLDGQGLIDIALGCDTPAERAADHQLFLALQDDLAVLDAAIKKARASPGEHPADALGAGPHAPTVVKA